MTGRFDVIGVVLLVAAAVVGLWIGLSGPDISPIFTEAPLPGGLVGGGLGR
jgi:hypothetical protein